MNPALLHALVLGPIREHPGRAALAVAAIALGVALGVAVHLINASALDEFGLAARRLAGEADLVVHGPPAGFDESIYPRVARLPQVAAANPALELDVTLARHPDSLRVIGFDLLRAAQVQPALLPERAAIASGFFDADSIWLSPAAAERLDLRAGDPLAIRVGTRTVTLKVAGLLPAGAFRQPIGIMDIAAAQWRLRHLGRLNRLDIRLKAGTDAAAFRRDLAALLPAGAHAAAPGAEGERGAGLTRAYRLNLDMLALVALLTGAFLVFSSQVLALLRRRAQLALLRALGMTRAALTGWLVAEGAVLGALGALLGVALGCGMASYALAHRGADLGAGYFRHLVADLHASPLALATFAGLGVLLAALGAAVPGWEAARREPAKALRAGDEEETSRARGALGWGTGAMAAGLLLTAAPPVDGLPLAGYAAIALVLLGVVLAMPAAASRSLAWLPLPANAPGAMAFARVKSTPRQAAISVAAIVSSFSLMVAMLIMVGSFRGSLVDWLDRMLPADIYLRAARAGETAFFTAEEQARIAATPGVAKVEFIRSRSLSLVPGRPPLTLLARPVGDADAAQALPLIGPSHAASAGDPPPVWASEVAADLYGWQPGRRIELPIDGALRAFTVAGIWRDYARQNGAIAMRRDLYREITGDDLVNDAALWVAAGASAGDVQHALRERLPWVERLEIATTREVKQNSLALFDRTFAITYALEMAAILIGLFGVSVSFSAQAIARRREFGVLRHLGMTRAAIGAMLATEGALTAALGAAFGLAAGWAIGLILIHVVNRQSFHWSMELHVPWLPIAGLALLVIAAAAATAAASGRMAMGRDVVGAVREDW